MTFSAIPDYLKPHLQHPLLSAEDERSFIAASQSGDRRARERVLRHNYRFCLSEADRFQRRYPYLELGDLFQSALLGLNEAIDRFDPVRDTRLIVFAKKHILFEMQRDSGVRKKVREYPADPAQFAERLVSQEELLTGLERLELLAQLRQKRREIWRALNFFPKWVRKLVVWRLLGKTFQQLGDLLGFSDQTASNKFKQYFPVVQALLVPPQVITPPRRSLRRLLIRRTPQLRLTTAIHRPTRVRKVRQGAAPTLSADRTPRASWPRVISKVVRLPQPICQTAERLKRSPLISLNNKGLRLFPLAVATATRSLVGRLFGWSEPPVFQERLHTKIVAPVSSSLTLRTIRGSPERSPPCAVT